MDETVDMAVVESERMLRALVRTKGALGAAADLGVDVEDVQDFLDGREVMDESVVEMLRSACGSLGVDPDAWEMDMEAGQVLGSVAPGLETIAVEELDGGVLASTPTGTAWWMRRWRGWGW